MSPTFLLKRRNALSSLMSLNQSNTTVNITKNKGRWSREQKRRHMIQSIGTGTAAEVEQNRQSLSISERLLQCAERASQTSAVIVKERHVEEMRNASNFHDGCDIQVITSSNLDIGGKDSIHCEGEDNSMRKVILVKPLLVLDLNGVLCHRIRGIKSDAFPHVPYRRPVCQIAGTTVISRPHSLHFLETLCAHFCLAVWTSAKSKNAKLLLQALFPPSISSRLLFVWSQNQCDRVVTDEQDIHDRNTLFVKSLSKVWNSFPLWNESNTLLMDDSPDKCPQIQNALHPPSLHGKEYGRDTSGTSSLSFLSDEENAARQQAFFEVLVKEHFAQPRVTWSNDKNEKSSSEIALWEMLQRYAVIHMGWRGEVRKP